MKEIVEAFALAQQSSAIVTCAEHGLSRENGMRFEAEKSGAAEMELKNEETGLHLFMLAAVGDKYHHDLDSVFQLIQANTGCLTSTYEEANTRKKKENRNYHE